MTCYYCVIRTFKNFILVLVYFQPIFHYVTSSNNIDYLIG